MKSSVFLVWLALFGSDPAALPSSGLTDATRTLPSTVWVGEWLVGGDRRPLSAAVLTVPGRDQLAGKLTLGRARPP